MPKTVYRTMMIFLNALVIYDSANSMLFTFCFLLSFAEYKVRTAAVNLWLLDCNNNE